jgi:hypothetical protein
MFMLPNLECRNGNCAHKLSMPYILKKYLENYIAEGCGCEHYGYLIYCAVQGNIKT